MAVNSLFNNLINVEFHEQPIYGLLSMQVCMVCCQCRYVWSAVNAGMYGLLSMQVCMRVISMQVCMHVCQGRRSLSLFDYCQCSCMYCGCTGILISTNLQDVSLMPMISEILSGSKANHTSSCEKDLLRMDTEVFCY